MSNLLTPEVPALYGALDSDAFTDGMAFSSHVLRELARGANSLAARAQHLGTMTWLNAETIAGDDGGTFNGLYMPVPFDWIVAAPPMPVFKMPGSLRAQVRLRAAVSNGHTVLLQFVTRGRPFDANAGAGSVNVLEVVGTGSVATYGSDLDAPGIPIHPSEAELITMYAKSLPTGAAASTDPNDSDDANAAGSNVSINGLTAELAGWTQTLVSTGAYVEFHSSQADVIARRPIAAVDGSGIELTWTEPLNAQELNLIRDARANSSVPWWYLLLSPSFGLVSWSAASIARTE